MSTTPAPLDDPKRLHDPPRSKRRPWLSWTIVLAVPLTAFATVLFLLRDGLRFDDSTSGWSAIWLGDVDADGVPDLALGVSSEPAALLGDGRVRILSGASGATLAELHGLILTNHLDEVVGTVSDLGGPGRQGLWWQSGYHALHVSADALGATSQRFEVDLGGPPSDLGDVDGDGAPDLLVSGFPRRTGEDTISAVSTRTGQALWTLAEPGRRTPGAAPFGWTACAAGDVDGDGANDAAIVDSRSRVLLVSGRSGALLRELDQRVNWISGILAPLGDVDGDGRPELAVYEAWNVGDSVNDESTGMPLRVVACVDGSVLCTFDAGGLVVDAWSPGDLDGDGLGEVAWRGSDGFAVARSADGVRLEVPETRARRPGDADYDGDGYGDSLVAHNVIVPVDEDLPPDLWRRGRIEIWSGRDGSLLRTFDERVLLPRGD